MIRTRRALRESGEELLEPQSHCGWVRAGRDGKHRPARTPSPVERSGSASSAEPSRQGQAVGSSPVKSQGFPYVLVPPHPSASKSTRPEGKSRRPRKPSKARGRSRSKKKTKADQPTASQDEETALEPTVAARRVSHVLTSTPLTIAIADSQGRPLSRRSSAETIAVPSSPTTAIGRINAGISSESNKQPSYAAFDAEFEDYGYEFAPYVEIPDEVRDALPDPVPGATAIRKLLLPPASRIPAPDEAVHFFYGRNWSCGAFSSSIGVLGRGRQGTRLARIQKYVTVFSWYNSQSKQCEQLPDGFTIPEPGCRISLDQLEQSIYDAIRRNSDLLQGMEIGLGVPRNGNPDSPPGFRYSYVAHTRPNEEEQLDVSDDEASDIKCADDRFSSPPAFDPAMDGDEGFGNWDGDDQEWEGCDQSSNGDNSSQVEQEPESDDLPSSSLDGSVYCPSQESARGSSTGPGETGNQPPRSSPTPTSQSPPRLTAKQKGKGRAVDNPPPSPLAPAGPRRSPAPTSPPRLTAKQKGKGRAVDNPPPSQPAPAGPTASTSQGYNPPPIPSFKRGRYDKDEKEIAAEMREWLEFSAKCCNRSPDSFLTLMGYPRTGEGLRKSQCWNKFRQWRKLQAENGEAEHISQEEMFEIYNRDYKSLSKQDKEMKIQAWSADIERWDKKPVGQQDKEFLQLMDEAQAMMEKLSRSGMVEPILYFLATDPFYGRFTRVMVGNDIVQEMLNDGAANLRQILSAAATAIAAAKTGTITPKDAKLLQILGLHNPSTNSSEAAVAPDTSSISKPHSDAKSSATTSVGQGPSRAAASSSSGGTSKRSSKNPGESAPDWGLYDPAAVKPDNVSQAAWDAEGKLPRDVFDWAELAQPGVLNVAKFWRQKQYETTVETVRDWGVRYMRFLLQVLYCQATGLKQGPSNGFYQGFADYLASNNKICEGWPPGCAVPDRDTKGSKALTRLWGSGAVELLDVAFGRKEGWTLRIIDFPPEAQAIDRDDTDPAYLDLPLITCNDASGKVTAVKATVRDANAWHIQEVAAQTARRKWADQPPERRKPLEAASAVKKWPPKLRKTGRTVKVKKEEGVEPEEQDEDGECTNLEEFDVEEEDGVRMDMDADENVPHHRDVVEPPRHPQPGPSMQSIPVYTGGDDDYYDADELFNGGYGEGGYVEDGEDQYMVEDFSNPEQYYDDQQQFNDHEIGRYHHRPNPQYTQTQHVSEYAQPLRATQTQTHPHHLIAQSSRAFRPTLAPQRHPNVYPIHATINNPTPRVFSNPLPTQPPVRPTTHRQFTQAQVLDHVKDMLKISGSPMKRKHQEQRMRPEGQSSRPASAVPWPSTRHAGGAHTLGQQGTRDDRPLKRCRVYRKLLNLVPGLSERLSGATDEDLTNIAALIQRGANQARSDDTKGLKPVIIDWLAPPDEPLHPSLSRTIKVDRGFNHERTGQLLCPPHIDWSNKKVREQLRNRSIIIGGDELPSFLWEEGTYDRNDIWKGFFKNQLLVKAFKHVFTSPSSVDTVPKATRSGNARIHGMTSATVPSLAYTAVQVRFALSSETAFIRTSEGGGDFEQFYQALLDIFEDPHQQHKVVELLAWYNKQVFPAFTNSKRIVSEDSPYALFKAYSQSVKESKMKKAQKTLQPANKPRTRSAIASSSKVLNPVPEGEGEEEQQQQCQQQQLDEDCVNDENQAPAVTGKGKEKATGRLFSTPKPNLIPFPATGRVTRSAMRRPGPGL